MTFRGKELVIIDGVVTDDFGVYVKDRPEVPTAERDIQRIDIRGRNGSLTKVYGYKDVEYTITMHMYEDDGGGFMKPFRLIKPKILNAKTLQFADDLSVYRKIKSVSILDTYNPTKEFGRFAVNFVLDPFMYEVDNPTEIITSRTTINNPGYEAEPVMTAHCNGTGNIYINDQEITIQNINGTITIDSEMQNAYRVSGGYVTNLNNHMIGKFPVLEHGQNTISFDGDITKIELIKNWRWV